jgi:hypothetical protein
MMCINSYVFQVLHVLENIKKESASDRINLSLCQEYCSSLADALESLEEEINNTLLRLVLEVRFKCHSVRLRDVVRKTLVVQMSKCY